MSESFQIIRASTPAERSEAFRLRYQIFVQELGYPAGGSPEEGLTDPSDESAFIFLAYAKGKAVGTLAVNRWDTSANAELQEFFHLSHFIERFPAASISVCHRALVSPEYRGSSLFMQLIHAAFLATQHQQSQLIFIDCAPYLVSYYERFGFRRYAPHSLHSTTGQLAVPMCLVLGDHAYLEHLGSPLLALIKQVNIPENPEAREYFIRHWTVERPSSKNEDIIALLTPPTEHAKAFDVYDSLLFRGLSRADIFDIVANAEHFSFQKRQRLSSAQEPSNDFLLLADGYLELAIEQNEQTLALGTCGPGDTIGEVNFLLQTTRSAQVTALSDGGALRFSREAMQKLTQSQPRLAALLYQNLSWLVAQRLRSAEPNLVECPVR